MTPNLDLRRRILEVAFNSNAGHIPSALSIVDIVATLYRDVMGADDRFVLSKGHGCLALYVVLEALGRFPGEELDTFCRPGSKFGGHPDANKIPGVEASTGSLGHGLPFALGLAYAKKIGNEPGRIFCLIGDGEIQEGSTIEAVALAARLDAAKLIIVVDCNGSHGVRGDIAKLLTALGYNIRYAEGHNAYSVKINCDEYSTYPLAVLADTRKGSGVRRMERDPGAWHRRTPTALEFSEMMTELT